MQSLTSYYFSLRESSGPGILDLGFLFHLAHTDCSWKQLHRQRGTIPITGVIIIHSQLTTTETEARRGGIGIVRKVYDEHDVVSSRT